MQELCIVQHVAQVLKLAMSIVMQDVTMDI